MEDSTLENKVSKMLLDFESMDDIQPSTGWNQSLMNRLDRSKPVTKSSFATPGLTVAVLLFILINLFFIVDAMVIQSSGKQMREQELLVISKEILVNPSSLNN